MRALWFGLAGRVWLATAAATLGCSGSSAPDKGNDGSVPFACGLGFLGDSGTAVALAVTALGVDGVSYPVADGATVPLIFPPQGGRVVFLGVRATNLDPCAVRLAGALRDPQTQQTRPDARTVNLARAADGWGISTDSDISSFANVPVCPNEWSSTDAFDHPYALTVSVTDRAGRTASKTLTVTLACAEPSRAVECLCICKKDYVLGQSCNDGGAADASMGDGGAE